MQLKILTQNIPEGTCISIKYTNLLSRTSHRKRILDTIHTEGKIKYRKGWLNFKAKTHFLTQKGENKAKEDARYLTHLPAKLVGGGKVHGDADYSDQQVRHTGDTK